jgi:hypothetical protein
VIFALMDGLFVFLFEAIGRVFMVQAVDFYWECLVKVIAGQV